ncbi:MAG: beta-N-acetylhexosaminidase [Cellulosilyticaceae bacterium]
MKFNGNMKDLELGIKAISNVITLPTEDTVSVICLDASASHALEISRGTDNVIKYQKPHHFFRALGLYAQLVAEGTETFTYAEKALIPKCGAMIDASRNSVYKVSKVKELLARYALMGHSTCMLYTEDTYELPDYPYFGYMRGRYTQAELREIDDFAYGLGIELIPCIQTLAHLKQTLKWRYALPMKDTADVLLVGSEKAYAFIEAMFKMVKETFRTHRIHIGMDEAFDLGRGQSIDFNGYTHHSELMMNHLNTVCELIRKYEMEPMMWDDMFFRALSPHGNHYDLDAGVSEQVVSSVPKELSLVYWDYYHADKDFYDGSFKLREAFNNPIIFAGGVWKWTGFAPNYDRTFITTNSALTSCKANGIQEVIATMWGDDGDETPIDACMLGLLLFGEHSYLSDVSEEWLNRRCQFLTGLSSEDFKCLQELDYIPGVARPNLESVNPHKFLAYQDVLMGAFDNYVKDADLYTLYSQLGEKYAELSTKSPYYTQMFDMYSQLAHMLSLKATFGAELREAYNTNDRKTLQIFIDERIPTLRTEIKEFVSALRKVWFNDCKAHGFEILDIRFGGVLARLETASLRIHDYLNGHTPAIEELEDTLLPFDLHWVDATEMVNINQYLHIASPAIFSHNI